MLQGEYVEGKPHYWARPKLEGHIPGDGLVVLDHLEMSDPKEVVFVVLVTRADRKIPEEHVLEAVDQGVFATDAILLTRCATLPDPSSSCVHVVGHALAGEHLATPIEVRDPEGFPIDDDRFCCDLIAASVKDDTSSPDCDLPIPERHVPGQLDAVLGHPIDHAISGEVQHCGWNGHIGRWILYRYRRLGSCQGRFANNTKGKTDAYTP